MFPFFSLFLDFEGDRVKTQEGGTVGGCTVNVKRGREVDTQTTWSKSFTILMSANNKAWIALLLLTDSE